MDEQLRCQAEGNALQHIAKCHAADQCRDEASCEQGPVPAIAPRPGFVLAAEFEGDRAQNQADQNHEHGQVKAREGHGIQLWPGRKDGAATQNQPDLVAFPGGPHGVDDDAALHIVLAQEGQQHAGTQVKAIHHGKADQ
ncbi:hypothetical protein D3C72_1896110 [compost metagenome]